MTIAEKFQIAIESSSYLAYIFAFLGGLLDCLTPCSAFATPVALGYFSSLNPQISRRRVFVLTAAFAIALSMSYALMGLLAAVIGGVVFSWLGQSPWPYWVVAVVLLYFVLINTNMLPMWLIPKPLRATVLYDFGAKQGTILGAVAIGIGVSLMMGPCAAPILTTILYLVAAKQDVVFGVTLLLVFSLGISGFMVSVSLLGRKAVTVLAHISKFRGYVGKAIDVIVLVIAVVLIYVGVEKAKENWAAEDTSSASSPVAVAKDSSKAVPNEAGQKEQSSVRFYSIGSLEEEKALGKGRFVKGAKMPDAEVLLEDGSKTSLAKLHDGKWLFLTFWGIWCKSCVEEIPLVKQMAGDESLKDRLVVIGVNVMDNPKKVREFVAKKKFNYPVLSDPEAEFSEEFLGVFSYPYNVIVNPDGVVVYASGQFPRNYKQIVSGGEK